MTIYECLESSGLLTDDNHQKYLCYLSNNYNQNDLLTECNLPQLEMLIEKLFVTHLLTQETYNAVINIKEKVHLENIITALDVFYPIGLIDGINICEFMFFCSDVYRINHPLISLLGLHNLLEKKHLPIICSTEVLDALHKRSDDFEEKLIEFIKKNPNLLERKALLLFLIEQYGKTSLYFRVKTPDALEVLKDNNILNTKTLAMVLHSPNFHQQIADNLVILHKHGYLKDLIDNEPHFIHFSKEYHNIIFILDKKNCLDKHTFHEINARRKRKGEDRQPFFQSHDVLFSLLNENNCLTKEAVSHIIFCNEKLSWLEHLKILFPSFDLTEAQFLELSSLNNTEPNNLNHLNICFFKDFISLWNALKHHDLDDNDMRFNLVNYGFILLKSYERYNNEVAFIIEALSQRSKCQTPNLRNTIKLLLTESIHKTLDNVYGCLEKKRFERRPKPYFYLLKNDHIFNAFYDDGNCLCPISDFFETIVKIEKISPVILSETNIHKLKQTRDIKVLSWFLRFDLIKNNVGDYLSFFQQYSDVFSETNRRFFDVIQGIERLPNHLFTPELFNWFSTVCQSATLTVEQKKNVINEHLLNRFAPQRQQAQIAPRNRTINNAQSTHTASVHLGTNITLWLITRTATSQKKAPLPLVDLSNNRDFLETLSPQEKIGRKSFISYTKNVNTLALTPAEKEKCLDYMVKANSFEENETIAKLRPALEQDKSLNTEVQLNRFILHLMIDVMANKPSEAPLEDVLKAFFKAAYESARGYNLNNAGEDLTPNAPNRPLCLSGTFNKFCEVLSAFSPHIIFLFASNESIMLRIKSELLEKIKSTVISAPKDSALEILNKLNSVTFDDNYYLMAWYENKESIMKTIVKEFSLLKTLSELNKIALDFEVGVLPDFPSLSDDGSQHFLTNGFIQWCLKTKAHLNTPSLHILSPNNQFFSASETKEDAMEIVIEQEYLTGSSSSQTLKRKRDDEIIEADAEALAPKHPRLG